LFLFLLIILFSNCASLSGTTDKTISEFGTEISVQGSIGRMETTSSGPLFTEEDGHLIRLAVLAPEAVGSVPAYLPLYIQGLLNNNFRKFSAITLIDRQNLDKIIAEQDIAANGRYSDEDYVTIGNLTNAEYYLIGVIQKLSGERYSLQFSITHSGSGVKQAVFMKDGTLAQLEGSGSIINDASAELLRQMGVKLTESGLHLLLAGNAQAVKSEAGLARGITAQAGGAEVEALFNYTQSLAFDPTQMEAISRLSILSSSISEGSISEKIVIDIMARNRWLEVFREAALFYSNHPPFEISFDPNLVQVGITDYARNTATIGMRIALDPSAAGFAALNALLEGLEKTGKRNDWGFTGWPLLDLAPKTQGTLVFEGKRSFSYKVNVSLVNEKNKVLGKSSISLDTYAIKFSAGDTKVLPPDGLFETLSFPNVKADDLTPILTIIIESVNGIPSRDLNASGYMKIDTADLEKRELESIAKRTEAERQAAAIQAQSERETSQSKAERKVFWNEAKRNTLGLAAFYHSANDKTIGSGYGLEAGLYTSPFQFTSMGIEIKGGMFGLALYDSSSDSADSLYFINVSPVLGIVVPLPIIGNIRLFADGILEIGRFGAGLKGMFSDNITYGFDFGVLAGIFTLKYRGAFYDRSYINSTGLGLSF
jgi:hypothetical protein